MPQRFNALKERLLRAGIAPRHVRRYLAELSDHLDDTVRQDGVSMADARARLGTDETLAAPMLAKTELRSFAAHYPWAAFGIVPMVIMGAVVYGALLLQLGVILSLGHFARLYAWHIEPFGPGAMTGRRAIDVFNAAVMYVGPLAIAAIFCALGIRQRIRTSWIVLGLAIVCIIGGFYEVGIKWSYTQAHGSELDLGLGVVAPFLDESLLTCLMRVGVNAAFAAGIYWLLRRREFRHAAV